MSSVVTMNRTNFFSELTSRLRQKEEWEVKMPSYDGSSADIVVKSKNSGKRTHINIRDAKEYGVLPIANIIPITRLVRNNTADKVFLISFSAVSPILADRLKELKVVTLLNPSLDEVMHEVNGALVS